MSISKAISALGLCAGAALFAQEVMVVPDTVKLETKINAEELGMVSLRFLSAEFGVPGKTVKGMPYQALAVTETTQTLADGNRIVHKSTALLARDSEGRTRREQKIDTVGQWSTGDQPSPLVFINDPVAQVNYVLESNTKTARKTSFSGDRPQDEAKIVAEKKALDSAVSVHVSDGVVKESLGSKVIEGVAAEGTRYTRTVPAGKIGNDRPLSYVTETWNSTDLGVTIMSRNMDPRSGETVYTLTNIQRSEPDPSLFTVPSDYTLKDSLKRITRDTREN